MAGCWHSQWYSVTVVTGPLPAGWAAGAPYDLILLEGAVPELPAALMAQLNPDGGRLMTILSRGAHIGHAVQAGLTPAGHSVRALFDAACPVPPAFAPAPAFAF